MNLPDLKKARLNLIRTMFPMSAIWHIKRGIHNAFEVLLTPFRMTEAATKAAADTLQDRFINKKESK